MTDNVDGFLEEVRSLYLQDPCRVSCIALWKLEALCRAGEVHRLETEGRTTLYVLRDRRLEFYWSDDHRHFALAPSEVAALQFLVLHEADYALIADQLQDCDVTVSNPMRYAGPSQVDVCPSPDVAVQDFDFADPEAFSAAADMLNRCYPGHRHTATEVVGWSDQPAFDPSLWFWIRDVASHTALALAISTYQPAIRETYLDWIQVLPEARGRGLGRLLVMETLRRALPKSDIVRVTGVADDFYRACGFVSTESWRIVRRG